MRASRRLIYAFTHLSTSSTGVSREGGFPKSPTARAEGKKIHAYGFSLE
jgi:hypothetical protein